MFADVIVDISHEKLDRPFEYIIPKELEGKVHPGSPVIIPFGKGNRKIKGWVLAVKDDAAFDISRLKEIDSIPGGALSLEGSMIELADFIRTNYGSTMNRALKVTLPVKKSSKPLTEKYICLNVTDEQVGELLEELSKNKRYRARLRLLKELREEKILPYSIVRDKLNISPQSLKSMERDALIRIDVRENLREVLPTGPSGGYNIVLNAQQRECADAIWNRAENGDRRPSLIHGITGSGKTEVYIDLISRFVKEGRQAIVLIPEISLTYQTVMRFYKKFGSRIAVMNSRLSQSERYDQMQKAMRGLADIMIGPRSALFTPFPNLGIIIIDEEHESTYKNETAPAYHAHEVAVKRAQMCHGVVVFGSATPSVETYNKAKNGEYALYSLTERASASPLALSQIVDMRAELNSGNTGMVSRVLDEKIKDRLSKGQQIILFINRRGHSGFVSCRNCGKAMECPHCSVSLKYHNNGTLKCHYCGYERAMVRVCPFCGSKYIGTFGAGTQKVEEEINRLYPQARTLRMDLDTTKGKDGHAKILSAFASRQADILIGTQMIVKGHDFENVTLVGIMAADLSLYSGNYQASERTFQLICQAAGRAGRGKLPGEVVIQTYSPENYAITLGAKQDYEEFFAREMAYRQLLGYPPVMNMLCVLFSGPDYAVLCAVCEEACNLLEYCTAQRIGPADAPVARINDRWRRVVYFKSENYPQLIEIKDGVEKYMQQCPHRDIAVNFDFSHMEK